jgi:diaminohydroxyphosphoribosylaminopyrimidine deaminase / 5-amino-6-(5-phosphoribosylamino)uracil reductase
MFNFANVNIHEQYMQRCLDLAEKGRQFTAPNPMVGAVIVHNGMIIGEGYHKQFGGPHAEVLAVHSVRDKALLKQSTMYVSLEPCSHHGKTPPCTSLIISSGIPEVVIATEDPNPQVKGSGIRILKDVGIKVHVGILKKQADLLNVRFMKFHTHHQPWVILKWAESADGYIDIERHPEKKGIAWISNPYSKQIVHQWRSEEAAILIGKNTAINDNPALTTREWPGKSPLRLLIDAKFEVSFQSTIYSSEAQTWCFYNALHSVPDDFPEDAKAIPLDYSYEIIPQILSHLYQSGINSLIVEGGKYTLEKFISSGQWDEARVISGNIRFEKGIPAPSLSCLPASTKKILDDRIHYYMNK